LADVCGALPKEISHLGEEVLLCVPYYKAVREQFLGSEEADRFSVTVGEKVIPVIVRESAAGGVRTFLLDIPELFDRDGIYGPSGGAFEDNDLRYAVFCRALLEAAKRAKFKPDVIHCHDWQTALIPVYLKTILKEEAFYAEARTLLTIHNLAYQGVFPEAALKTAGLDSDLADGEKLGHYNQANFLKGGLVFADILNTVSPTYAKEILTEPFGCGLDWVLRRRAKDLHGILNGLDLKLWDPAGDGALPIQFSANEVASGKAAAKASVRKECGFLDDPNTPLMSIVSRLDHQKGLDVALEVLPDFIDRGGQFVIVGTGDPVLEKAFTELAGKYPDRAHHRKTFDDPFARRVYAGADFFLMPSRFEPCGLGQMIAMRYGTIPIAVRTGGLADTVPARGFVAEKPEPELLGGALKCAEDAFNDETVWFDRVLAAMAEDFAWGASAEKYCALYRKVSDGASH
jgi:starch synthase